MTNNQVIAFGGGSPQARSHRCGGDCPICNPKDETLTCPICGRITKDGEKCAECQQDADEAMGVE